MQVFEYKNITFTVINKRQKKVGTGSKKSPGISIDPTFAGSIEIPSFAVFCSKKYIVSQINSYSFNYSKITEVFIPSTISIIEERSFYRCKSLLNVTFEENSALKIIGRYAFYDAYHLKGLYISSKCIKEIGEGAFRYSYSMKNVFLGSANKIGEYAFSGLSSITDFYFCGANTISTEIFKNVTNPGGYYVPNDLRIHASSLYQGSFAALDVNDRDYKCPSQTCVREYYVDCSCKLNRRNNNLIAIAVALINA